MKFRKYNVFLREQRHPIPFLFPEKEYAERGSEEAALEHIKMVYQQFDHISSIVIRVEFEAEIEGEL